MNFERFSLINRDRCESAQGFNHALDSWSLSDWITAVLGELGEAANVVKKLNRVRDGIPGNKQTPDELRQMLASELADTDIYLDLLRQAMECRIVFDRLPVPAAWTLSDVMAAVVREFGMLATVILFGSQLQREESLGRMQSYLGAAYLLAGINREEAIIRTFDAKSKEIGYPALLATSGANE